MTREERLLLMVTLLYAACPHITNVSCALSKALEIEIAVKDYQENL
jgi:hypothetical protein